MLGGNQVSEQATPIVSEDLNTYNLKFDELKFDKWTDQHNLINFVKTNIEKLKGNTQLINKCKEYFNDTKKINAIINNKKAKANLNNYYNSDPADSSIWAVGFLLTALDWKELQNKITPTGQDVYSYLNTLKKELNTPQDLGDWQKQEAPEESPKPWGEEKQDPNTPNSSELIKNNEKLSQILLSKRRQVVTDLWLKAPWGGVFEKDRNGTTNREAWGNNAPEIYQRDWHSGIYKFSDDGADLVYISSEQEKNGESISRWQQRFISTKPNQIYTFDENYNTKIDQDWIISFEDKAVVDGNWDKDPDGNGEIWTFISNPEEKGNSADWRLHVNSEDFYTETDWKKSYKYKNKNWSEIQQDFKGNEDKEKNKTELGQWLDKSKENMNTNDMKDTKALDKALSEVKLLDDVQKIYTLENNIDQVDEQKEIKDLITELTILTKEYTTIKNKDTWWVQKLEDAKNAKIQKLIEQWTAIRQKINSLKSDIERDERKLEKIQRKREKLIKRLDKAIKEKEKIVAYWEGLLEEREYSKEVRDVSLLTQVLKSQQIFLDLWKGDSEYSKNDTDQIVKEWEKNINYTMDNYGRLIKNEQTWDTITASIVEFDDWENEENKNQNNSEIANSST